MESGRAVGAAQKEEGQIRTGGALNCRADSKTRRVCSFPIKAPEASRTLIRGSSVRKCEAENRTGTAVTIGAMSALPSRLAKDASRPHPRSVAKAAWSRPKRENSPTVRTSNFGSDVRIEEC